MRHSRKTTACRFVNSERSLVIDWEPMVREMLADRVRGEPIPRISARFHNALARLAVHVAAAADCGPIVLTGGCFQNALLSDRVRNGLLAAGHVVYTHQQVPPGDGGIAFGQIFVAAREIQGAVVPASAGMRERPKKAADRGYTVPGRYDEHEN